MGVLFSTMPTPLPILPGTHRCALNWVTASGQHAVNVMHISRDDGLYGSSNVMTLLNAHVTAAMWDTVASAWSVSFVAITPLDGISSTTDYFPATPAHWQGNTGGDFVPNVASIVKMQTGVRGRDNRGRLFLPSPAESQISNGKITDGTDTTASLAWSAFLAAIAADATTPSHLVVAAYDRKHHGLGAHVTDVTVVGVETILATQRRRQTRLR